MRRALVILVALACVLQVEKAWADANDPLLGHCLLHEKDGKTCALSEHFSAIVPMFAIDLRHGDLVAGLDAGLGICRGLTFGPTSWWASGLDLCASFRDSHDEPYRYAFSLLGFLADYGAAGAGLVNTGGTWSFFAYFAPRLPVQ